MPLTTNIDAFLTAAWRETCRHYGSDPAAAEQVFAALAKHYSGTGRFYHTFSHVAAMLRTINSLRTEMDVPDLEAVRLALWFHDAIYDSRAKDNEEQSAAFTSPQLPLLGVPAEQIYFVEKLILATNTHQSPLHDIGCQALLDADLAILGSNAAGYDFYVQDVRREYAWVAEDDWRAGRSKVLRSFLGRERIFQTPPMFRLLEDRARQNLRHELDRLT